MVDIKLLGHATFKITGSKVIFTDPFQLKQSDTADIILISHSHFDHCSPEDLKKIAKSHTEIFATSDCDLKGIPGKVTHVVPNKSYKVDNITIKTIPAYNTNKDFHPKSKNWVGYIIEIDGESIYHTGDTDFIPEMYGLKVDVALLPVSGTYVMTAEEAAEAFKSMNAKKAIPMHYGAIVGSKQDAEKFNKLIN